MTGGQELKVNLCADCPKLAYFQGEGACDMLKELAPEMMPDVAEQTRKVEQALSCPQCGFTLADLERARRLGCAECYSVFKEQVTRLVKAVQHGGKHVGKFSQRFENPEHIQTRLKELQHRLNAAVQEEQYENAASLRDEIRRLEEIGKGGNEGGGSEPN